MKTKLELKQQFYMKGVEVAFHQLMKIRSDKQQIFKKEDIRVLSSSTLSEDYIDILIELLDETGYFNSEAILKQLQSMGTQDKQQLND